MNRVPFFLPLILPLLASPVAGQEPASQAGPFAVKVVPAEAATEMKVVALPARTYPMEQTLIQSRATGIISERPVDIGDRVEQGQLLARVSAPEVEFQLESARAALRQAEAGATLAKNELERARALAPTRAIAAETIDLRAANLAQAEAEIAAAKAEISRLETLVGFQTITAPFPGIITGRQVDRGAHVRGDMAMDSQWLFQLSRMDELRVVVDATPEVALRVSPGSEAELVFPDLPAVNLKIKVVRRTNLIDSASGTMRLELVLPNPDFTIPAGLIGNARFTLAPLPGITLVPTNTLLTRQGKPHVFVVEEGKAREVAVVPGRNLGPKLEILSGLTAGQPVVLSPNSLLQSGQTVAPEPIQAKK
jgi:RND family efflux transporter MFP subunit